VTDNKFRAVLTIFASQKVLEIRFDDLNEDKTKVSVIINSDNRHNVDEDSFMMALLKLTSALNRYADNITIKMILNKMMGMV
jgi:hypothetical protein